MMRMMMLKASKCIMWLSIPMFMQTEWLDNWRGIQGSMLEREE
jgi:hypothetical protein